MQAWPRCVMGTRQQGTREELGRELSLCQKRQFLPSPLCPAALGGPGLSEPPTVLSGRPVFTHRGHGTAAVRVCRWVYLKCHYPLLSNRDAISSGKQIFLKSLCNHTKRSICSFERENIFFLTQKLIFPCFVLFFVRNVNLFAAHLLPWCVLSWIHCPHPGTH